MTLSTSSTPVVAPAAAGAPAGVCRHRHLAPTGAESCPTIVGKGLTLRGLRLSDAASLLAMLSTEEVARFLSPPPTTVEGFERFIKWTDRKRQEGTYVCFAVVPAGMDMAVGFFQVRALDAEFRTAEWGFALGKAVLGHRVCSSRARRTRSTSRSARSASPASRRAPPLRNGRGNGALRKIGAMHEAVLRRSFHRHGEAARSGAVVDSRHRLAGGPRPLVRAGAARSPSAGTEAALTPVPSAA